MHKRLAITMMVAAFLVLLVSSVAGAWFEAEATSTVRGKTGLVKITTVNVTLSRTFQPGDTQYAWIKVHNAGRCPIKILNARILGLPGFLGATIAGPLGQTFNPCNVLWFKLYVKMPTAVKGPQDHSFSFKVRFYARNVPTAHPTVPK